MTGWYVRYRIDPDKVAALRRRRRVRWHYRLRIVKHPLVWWRERCVACGRRRFPGESMILVSGTDKYHDACHAAWHWRLVAKERLAVLDVVADVWGVDGPTVQEVMAGRVREGLGDEANARNLAWRVFYDLGERRGTEVPRPGGP